MREVKQKFTRAIQREYKRIQFLNAVISNEWREASVKINMNDNELANDYLVKTLFWLSDDELDNLSAEEFDELLWEAGKLWGLIS